MIEAIIIFKDGIQTHLTLNVTFEDVGDEIETKSKINFAEFNEFNNRIPSYINVLGKLLKKEARKFWKEMDKINGENSTLKIPEVEKMTFEEEDQED
ncbi:hypothetical protein LCGC14_2578630 [marine sediment metagenome]|uniref:Propeptide carboxypeptidase Y domain-containing protein n=1 Tax=marine sediment metagenome TaxID=412755 RepID=A0A0F9AF32_9ZZZZ